MQTLAHWDGGPGPWILFFPLIWAAVVVAGVTLLRRTGRRGGPPWRSADPGRPRGDSPLAALGRRFASGEIDEDEYWRRASVLEEHFGAVGKPPAA
ncbi:SHOCT domain-containing protein [Streptomyces sp. C1-2]|uniref:SHOCT domain-containing protein n=1 Tax=Streptomyces sp. C1-2 TaxID=2720022 RepID=UPI00143233FA|nr:SHOCT domain-containing protein [Streptomyces sp. C1-2]NJP73231.1 SHOCT domain-containing protein [Streptomyces sp. C1-2]